jgi:DNA-binding winged helix-turn-helix (wHTH) protein
MNPDPDLVTSQSSAAAKLRFGIYELDLKNGELRKAGQRLKLQPQPFKVLAILAGRAGETVTREEIQHQVWGEELFVDFERGLNACIQQIRGALNDDAEAPRYIETLPKRGYRFLASVEKLQTLSQTAPPERAAGRVPCGGCFPTDPGGSVCSPKSEGV